MNSFEDYLKVKHIKERPELLDDEIADNFDNWLTQFDANDILEMVKEYEKY